MTVLNERDFDDVFSVMEKSFPSDEYRPKSEQRALLSNSLYNIYGEHKDGKLYGFIAAWKLEDFIYIEHFAVEPSFRGGGIGSKMITELVSRQSLPCVLEVEPPTNELCRRRIAFYERNGFVYNEYEYIQPAISKGKNAIPLRIMTSRKGVSEEMYTHIRDTLYHNVYHTSVSEVYR